MIAGKAYLRDEYIHVEYQGENKEELKKMKEIVKGLVGKRAEITQDSENQFRVRIDKRAKQIARKLLEKAGEGKKIGYDVGITRELHDYLELKWV